jgi:hypothetical protein
VFSARYAFIHFPKTDTVRFKGLEEKIFAKTNLFVKQVDSIAARGSCIFLGILLRDYFGSCHAVKREIKKYVTFCSILWLACYF